MPESDAAIVMLNYYAPAVVERAVASIVRQTSRLTWTLYLGFHHRTAVHQADVRSRLGGLPVHEVPIERDLVMDARARDIVLQEALRAGRHRWLFFLDDDDEWYPMYLARMTASGEPFALCAKDVHDDATGAVEAVADDPDYESMACAFGLWAGRHLPHFAGQGCDKLIVRDFKRMFPGHPVITEPLYRVHRHADSLTFRKVLGRSRQRDLLVANRLIVAGPSLASFRSADACEAIAASLGAVLVDPGGLAPAIENCRSRPIVIAAESALEAALGAADSSRTGAVVVGLVEDPPEAWRSDAHRHPGADERLMARGDALLLADPSWADACEAINSRSLPVGVPSRMPEADILTSWQRRSVRHPPRLYIHGAAAEDQVLIDAVRERLPSRWQQTGSLTDADVCWWPDRARNGWGAPVCRAFEQGVPCVTTSRTAVSRVLFGASGLLVDSAEPALLAERIQCGTDHDFGSHVRETLPLFRRAYGPFYWVNTFTAHLANALPGLLEGSA